jgi:hypothetical protein
MYEATAVIGANPETIWPILTNLAAWSQWESAVVKTEGHIAEGSRIKIWPEVDPKRAFPVKVVELDGPRAMTFLGGMPLGLFRGRRTYRLVPEGPHRTRFTMREEYSGPLAPLITKSIPDLQPSFNTFAEGLRKQAEARHQ